MRRLLLTYLCPNRYRYKVLMWLAEEWEKYADEKLASMDLHDEKWMRESGFSRGGDWQRQILQYWDRANIAGLDSPQGRQLMMKSATTLIDGLAAMIKVYGPPPPPGYPSGEIHTRGGVEDGQGIERKVDRQPG